MSEPNSMDFDPTNCLKRCSSTPTINNILPTPNKNLSVTNMNSSMNSTHNNLNLNITASRSRDASPTPTPNIFAPRARRYSTGFSPLATNPGPLPRLTPRVSQLRQEECADLNSREVNHEREVHSAIQISQSWEDLSLDAEHWSSKNDTDLTNPLHVTLPTGVISCSSPSPTSSRTTLRLPYGLSPSPTRRTFQTRRSMSPIAMRPSSLGPVKRKFELDDSYSNSPPPFKKMFSERGQSPCQSPLLQTCPSPDSTEGRTTPKFYISKLFTTNTNSSSSLSSSTSAAPSPGSTSGTMEMQIDIPNSLAYNSVTSNTDSNNSSGTPTPINSQSMHTHSEHNSDLDGSDIDSDSQMKATIIHKKNDETCNQLKNLFFERVRTDSTDTETNSIDFKNQTKDEHIPNSYKDLSIENKILSIEFDSNMMSTKEVGLLPTLLSSINEVELNKPMESVIESKFETIKSIENLATNVSASNMINSVNSTENL